MSRHYVYIYRNPAEDMEPFYVGKGTGKRWRDHLRGNGSNRFMQAKLKKISEDGISAHVEIIHALDESHAYLLEECLIEAIGRRCEGTGPLVNLSAGGEGGAVGVRRSEETRRRMSMARLGVGRPHSDATKARMSASHTGMAGPNLGKKFGRRARVCCVLCGRETAANVLASNHVCLKGD